MSQALRGFDDIELSRLRRRRSYKWRKHGADVIPAFVAEMDFPLAQPIAGALHEMVHLGDTGYACRNEEVVAALAGFARRSWSWSIDPASVFLVPDVMVGVLETLRLALEPGDAVIVNTPVYPPFFAHIAEAGCRAVRAPLGRAGDGRYRLDLSALERCFAGGARAYLLCNPHNPTGIVPSREELAEISAIAKRHQALVISDEIHAPLVLSGATHTPYLSLAAAAEGLGVALLSASKAWNVPGLKCAQLVAGSDALRHRLSKLPEAVTYRTGIAGIVASIAAYRESAAWLGRLLRVLERNRALMSELLSELLPDAGYVPPDAGYLAWIDCTSLGAGDQPARTFLERGRVAVQEGREFGPEGAGHVRVTMGTSASLLREIVERMSAALR